MNIEFIRVLFVHRSKKVKIRRRRKKSEKKIYEGCVYLGIPTYTPAISREAPQPEKEKYNPLPPMLSLGRPHH